MEVVNVVVIAELHEIIRKCSMEATERMKNGEECDLLKRLVAVNFDC